MKVAIVALSKNGRLLADELAGKLINATVLSTTGNNTIAQLMAANWQKFDAFLCIMASGIVVRAIAPLLADKYRDPCVLVMDPSGHHVISLLGGHIGGGNALAKQIAALTRGTAVITTASDNLGVIALDLWAKGQNLVAEDRQQMTAACAKLVDKGYLNIYTEEGVHSLPPELIQVAQTDQADVLIAPFKFSLSNHCLLLHPRTTVIGVGCNRDTPPEEFELALNELLSDLNLARTSIRNLASIDKKNDETGLLQFAASNGWRIDFFNKDQINTLTELDISHAAMQAVGAIGVAEPAALLSSENNRLLSRKRKWKNITMAVAQAPFTLSAQVLDQPEI